MNLKSTISAMQRYTSVEVLSSAHFSTGESIRIESIFCLYFDSGICSESTRSRESFYYCSVSLKNELKKNY